MLANKRFGVLVDKLYKAGIYIPPASPDTWAVRRLVRNICDMLSLTFRVRSTSSSAVPFLSSWIFQPSLRILFLLVLFTSVISDVHSTTDDQKCNATVVSLPVSNVTLSSGSQMRGIYAQIGTPPQKISMLPNLGRNYTYVDNGPAIARLCASQTPGWSVNKCVNHKGGVFNPTGSSTFKNLTGLDLDIPKDRILYSGPDFEHGWATTDVLHFGEQSLKDFLIILSDNSQTEPGDHATMALGPGSELLESLIDKSIIATRSFAYDQGLTGDPTVDPKSWVDGQLTLGGYDKSRFTGELFPIQLSDDLACKAKVVVEQITLRNSTGSIDLMGNQKSKAGSLMYACVVPEYPLISLPGDMFDEFDKTMNMKYQKTVTTVENQQTITNVVNRRSTGSFYWWGLLDEETPFYDGTMTIKLGGGFTATISNSELMKPYRDLAPNGDPIIVNGTTQRAMLINPLRPPNDNDLPLLGMPFLSAAYMIMDYDQNLLRLAQPVRSNKGPDLIPILPSGCDNQQALPTATPKSGASGSPVSNPPDGKKTLSVGAIVGIIAAALLLVLVVLGTVLWLKRRRQRVLKQAVSDYPAAPQNMYWTMGDYPTYENGIGAYGYAPQEIDSRTLKKTYQEMDGVGVTREMEAPQDRRKSLR